MNNMDMDNASRTATRQPLWEEWEE